MVQEPSQAQTKAPWTKIFTAFKVALDAKKLVLAAAGIFLVALGWWAISWTFYGMRGELPQFENKRYAPPDDAARPEREQMWKRFKAGRNSWNLIHELAGPPAVHVKQDAADVTSNHDEYVLLHKWEEDYRRLSDPIVVKNNTLEVPKLESNQKVFKVTPIGDGKLQDKTLTVESLIIDPKQEKIVIIDGVMASVDDGKFEDLKKYREGALTPEQIAAKAAKEENQKIAQEALTTFRTHLVKAKYKPSGRLRIWPWFEDRGPNQYLIVANTLKTHDATGTGGSVLHWLLSEKALVLVEPLVKFLLPLVYLFDHRAGGWDRLYLIFIILWTLTIWGFFGGAICRIAAVQVARNERISLREAIAFTRERFASYVAAPVFPLVLLAIFVIVLILFGWIEWIPYIGDLFAGLFWPIVILIGFIMAIVLVGLIGWPLMIATISTEGTDSFDALSRSYSYVYQAPWQYLWYNFLALLYGAVLVFFVGFMASLMVFLGKWGVSSAPGPAKDNPASDREPSYLFCFAPTSYGWRDLLIGSNTQFVEPRKEIAPNGREVERLYFKQEYEDNMGKWNYFGAILVSIWIYPLFLLVLAFGYSYFWSSSTIIYFLMRRYVDDTELDEVHQEDEDLDDPFMKTATEPAPAAPAPPPPSKPGTLSLSVVEAPVSPPPPPPPSFAADAHPPTASTTNETGSPPRETQLAPPPFTPPETPPADGHT